MRIVGAVFLIAACTLLGAGQARKMFFHKRCLEGFLDALRYMDAELKNGAVPVPDIFRELGEMPGAGLKGFFGELNARMEDFGERSLADVWSGCVLNYKSVELTMPERQELCRVGNYLGRFSESEQSEAIQACIAHLGDELTRLTAVSREKAKLYTGLGVTAGLMLATVLI